MQKKFIVNNKEYTVLKLLGHGKSGYSYKVIDKQNKIWYPIQDKTVCFIDPFRSIPLLT